MMMAATAGRAQLQLAAPESGPMLAISVSGIDCVAATTAAVSCTLHAGSTTTDGDQQLHELPGSTFAPCEEGLLLVSSSELMQHTLSSSLLSTASLRLAASCSDHNATTPQPAWTQTLMLTADDLMMHPHSTSSNDSATSGYAQHLQEFGLVDSSEGWEQQLLLVDLVLPPTSAGETQDDTDVGAVDEPEDGPSSLDVEGAEAVGADSSAGDAKCAISSWKLWLARAGLVVFVSCLQLLPYTSSRTS